MTSGPRPTDEDVLSALRVVAAWLGIGPTSLTGFTQDALPADCKSRDVYLRVHRDQVKAGTDGWSRRGKVRSVTAEAWATYVGLQTSRRPPPPRLVAPARNLGAELDAELGIRTRRTA